VNGPFTQIATVAAGVETYSSTGLNPNTEYFYRVRAFSSLGANSAYSNVDSATTLPNPPAAPSGLTATAVSNSQIDLIWADNASNEDSFKVERKLTSAALFTEIATLGPNVTSYSSTGLATTTSYDYRVRAKNTGGPSGYSNTASATTLIEPPVAPDSLAAVAAGFGGVNLTWGDDSNNEDGFKIERKLTAAPMTAFAQIAQAGMNIENYSDTGLAASTAYTYRVRAFRGNPNTHSAYTDTVSVTTNVGPPTPPTAPDSLVATAVSNNQIDLEWDDNSSDESSFDIEIGLSAGGPFNQIGSNVANDVTFQVTGLEANTQYFFRVKASNGGGSSGYTNVANATTLPDPPAAPSSLTASAVSFTQINLAWTDNAGNELGFKIERKLNTVGASYAQIATVGPNVTSYSDPGLAVGTAYTYRVRSYNSLANSAYSNEANATTNVPAAPSALMATVQNNIEVNLAWTDNSTNEAGFIIEMKVGPGGTFAVLDSVGADVTGFLVQALNPNTEYSFQVRAYNLVGNSAYSNTVTVTTLPDPPVAPSGLAATAASSSQIDLTWTDNTVNEAGFRLQDRAQAHFRRDVDSDRRGRPG
jgi:titin